VIRWTLIPTANAYYVYVGTTAGSTDILNSGEIPTPQTQLTVPSPPPGTTFYLRLWTKAGGVWRYTDGTVNPLLVAVFTSPTSSLLTDLTTFRWTSVIGAQAYYLYVGTAPGSADVMDSKELSVTQLPARNLLRGQTLYLRLWTKLGGAWRFTDSTVLLAAATVTHPLNGASAFNPWLGLQWTYVAGAQAYMVWVGTTVGGADVYQGRETSNTFTDDFYPPTARRLYVRLWTKRDGIWRYIDSEFSVLAASILLPGDWFNFRRGEQWIFWEPITGAQAYYVYIGSTPGASDLVNSGEFLATSYTTRLSYPGSRVYVRLWTKLAGVWRYTDTVYQLS
jgi:hypothetical protein